MTNSGTICMRRIVPIVMIAAVLALATPVASVRAAEGIQVSPSIIEKRIDPGASFQQTIRLHNTGPKAQVFYPSVKDISGVDENGAPVFVDEKTTERIGAELSSWTTLSATQVSVPGTEEAGGSDALVVVTITVPADAPLGGAFGAVVFTTEPPELATDDSAVAIGYSVGSLIAIRIGDAGTDESVVREFRSDKRVYGTPAVTFTTKIENKGSALSKPYGEIQVFDTFGRFTASVSFNGTLGGILPKQVRSYTTQWAGSGFAFGRYKAVLISSYGESVKKSLISETTFWVIPAKLTLIVVAVTVGLFLIVFFWIRSYIRRTLRRSGAGDAPTGGPISFFAVFISIVAVAAIIVGIIFFLLA